MLKYSTDPRVIGPGTWFSMTIDGYAANDDTTIKVWIQNFYNKLKFFPCGDCTKHWEEYATKNPPDQAKYVNYTYQGRRLGMLLYIVEFHNAVNVRLGKRTYTFADVLNSLDNGDTGFCDEGCATLKDLPNKIPSRSSTLQPHIAITSNTGRTISSKNDRNSIIPISKPKQELVSCMNNFCAF